MREGVGERVRGWVGRARSVHAAMRGARAPGVPGVVSLVVMSAVFVVMVLVLIPALLVGAAVVGVLMLPATARAWVRRARGPNGALDGRKNVRVIVREE